MFFYRELRWCGNSQFNIVRMSQYKGLSSENNARLFGIAKYYSLPSSLAIDGLNDVTQ